MLVLIVLNSLINSNRCCFFFCRFLGILYRANHVTCKERKFYFFFSFYFLPFLIVLPIISNTTFNKTDGNEDYFFVSDPRDKLKSLPYEWCYCMEFCRCSLSFWDHPTFAKLMRAFIVNEYCILSKFFWVKWYDLIMGLL